MGSYDSTVSWSATNGTITPAGLFKVTTLGDAKITATSAQDPTKSGFIIITYNSSSTSGLLYGVALSPTAPRSLVSLDPATGTSTSIYTFPQENVTVLSGGALDVAGNRYFQVVSSGQTYQLDTIDLTGRSPLQVTSNVPDVTNLTYNTTSGLLYGVALSSTGPRSLVSLDPSTGSSTSIYTFPVENTTVLSGGALDAAGNRYFQIVSSGQTYQLDTIDLTGISSLRVTSNVPDVTNLAYNTASGLLYGVALPPGTATTPTPRLLVSLDSATGTSVPIYSFPLEGATTLLSGGALDSAENRYFQIVSAGQTYQMNIIDLTGGSLRTTSNVPDATNLRF